jgi:hypothetical protein
MGIFLTFLFGLIVWIVLWAIGAKGFDSFLITVLLLLIAVAAHAVFPFLPGNRPEDQ